MISNPSSIATTMDSYARILLSLSDFKPSSSLPRLLRSLVIGPSRYDDALSMVTSLTSSLYDDVEVLEAWDTYRHKPGTPDGSTYSVSE